MNTTAAAESTNALSCTGLAVGDAEEYDDFFDVLKIRHSTKNNGQKCPRLKRPGWSNQAVKLISKSRKIIRICQKMVFQTPSNNISNPLLRICFPNLDT